jgi:two-component system, cell cycle sensor histidine kinase and response regulator CckA
MAQKRKKDPASARLTAIRETMAACSGAGVGVLSLDGALNASDETLLRVLGLDTAVSDGKDAATAQLAERFGGTDSFHRFLEGVPKLGVLLSADYSFTVSPHEEKQILVHARLAEEEDGNAPTIHIMVWDISEHEQAQVNAIRSWVQYQEIIEKANSAILRLDTHGYITHFNLFAERLFGYTAQEILGQPVTKILTSSEKQADQDFTSQIGNAITHPDLYFSNENESICRDGRHIWLAWTSKAMLDETGAPKEILCIGNDITDRKNLEDTLRASERRYRQITEAITDYVFNVRVENQQPAGTIHAPACFQVTGYTPEEFNQDPYLWIRMVPEEDQTIVRLQAEAILSTKDAPSIEHRIIRKDGAIRWVQNTPVSYYDGNGDLIAYDGVIRDITAHKQAEDALRASEQRFRLLVEHTGDALFLHDDNGSIFDVNQQACDSLGYTHDELLTFSMARIEVQHALDLLQKQWNRARPGQPITMEGIYRRKDGQTFPVEVRVSEFESGARSMFLSQARDITDRVRAEEQQKELEAQLQQAQKLESLAVMAGGIAHDFNNLLMCIMGNAELAAGTLPSASKAQLNLKEIGHASRRAADLCQQMLAFSGHGCFVVEHLQLDEIAQELCRLLSVSLPEHVSLVCVPSTDTPSIRADAIQIRQALHSIITNAVEALGDEVGSVQIRTGAKYYSNDDLNSAEVGQHLPEGRYVFVEVTDTGCGMDEETVERIFDPFFTTKFMGRGLGLAAVLGIVRGHDGAILLQSAPKRGTVFTLLFPLSVAQHARNTAADKPQFRHTPGKVLVVDDEDAVRNAAKYMLEHAGFVVLAASDGLAAKALFEQHQNEITVAILDLTVPGLSGEDLYHFIRSVQPEIPVIFTSGFHEDDLAAHFPDQGNIWYLQKPYRIQALIKILKQVLYKDHAAS